MRQADHRGAALPDFILNAPEIPDCDRLYFDAFVQLDTCRPSGFGPGSIPWDKVLQYGHYLELSGDALIDFVDIIMLTDGLYMRKVAEDMDAKKGAK